MPALEYVVVAIERGPPQEPPQWRLGSLAPEPRYFLQGLAGPARVSGIRDGRRVDGQDNSDALVATGRSGGVHGIQCQWGAAPQSDAWLSSLLGHQRNVPQGRHAMGRCPPKEVWLRAGHNTDSQAQLTQLNWEAHTFACRGRHEARAYTAPWLPLLHGRVAAFWTGQRIMDVSAFESVQSVSTQAGSLPRLRPPPSPPAHADFVADFLADSMPRLALRRVYALRLLDRRLPPAALTALSCPFCDDVVEDLVLHLRAACWHYLGFVVSALGAVCWLDGGHRRFQGSAQLPAYWVVVPDGAVGLWDPLHPGVAAPLGPLYP